MMKVKLLVNLLGLIALLLSSLPGHAKELKDLKVLYVGSERTDEFVPFLKQHLAQVESRNRSQFKPADAAGFDVVLLDWPQGAETREMRKMRSPLGSRDDWSR